MLLQQHKHKPKPSNVRVRAGTLVASALKRSLCECRPSNSWFLSGSSQLGQRQQLVNRAQRLPSALSRSPECAIERTHARAAKPQPITHEPTALAAMPRAPPGGKPRPPPTRPKMQSVGEDDSDEESFAFVVPSRHGSPREPSPRIPVLYNVGKEKPLPPPGRPPVKKDASAAVAAANAMWTPWLPIPSFGWSNALATDPIIRGAQRDSFDDYIGARRLSDDLGDDFPADDETTANAFVVPSRSQSRSRKPAPPKKPPPTKKRAAPVESLSSDSDSHYRTRTTRASDLSCPRSTRPSPPRRPSKGQESVAGPARPSSEGRRDEESKPSSQAVERAQGRVDAGQDGAQAGAPEGPAPPRGLCSLICRYRRYTVPDGFI